MSLEDLDFFWVRVLPDVYLVISESVCRYKLVSVLRERKTAHLTIGLDAVNLLARVDIPESYSFISRSTTRCKKTVLVGRPCNCLYSCLMLRELILEVIVGYIPDEELVIIASTSKRLLVTRPLKSTYFVLMSNVLSDDRLVSEVLTKDVLIFRATSKNFIIYPS